MIACDESSSHFSDPNSKETTPSCPSISRMHGTWQHSHPLCHWICSKANPRRQHFEEYGVDYKKGVLYNLQGTFKEFCLQTTSFNLLSTWYLASPPLHYVDNEVKIQHLEEQLRKMCTPYSRLLLRQLQSVSLVQALQNYIAILQFKRYMIIWQHLRLYHWIVCKMKQRKVNSFSNKLPKICTPSVQSNWKSRSISIFFNLYH